MTYLTGDRTLCTNCGWRIASIKAQVSPQGQLRQITGICPLCGTVELPVEEWTLADFHQPGHRED